MTEHGLLEQKCITPGHWLVEGRHVRAVFTEVSPGRKVMHWTVDGLDGEQPPSPFPYFREARDWIRDNRD